MADSVRIDPGNIYAIGAAARLLGVSASTLRDLERRGKIEGERTPGGQRRFTGASLIRLLEESNHLRPRRPRPVSGNAQPTDDDVKARAAWLEQAIAGAQREVPTDTPAEIRHRLAIDLEAALRPFGPSSPRDDVSLLVKSLVEQIRA